MANSLPFLPTRGDTMSPTYLHTFIDDARVRGLEAGGFRRGNYLLFQTPHEDCPTSPPFLTADTTFSLGATTVSFTQVEVYSFSGSGRDSRAFGWHAYSRYTPGSVGTRPAGEVVHLTGNDDLRDGTVSLPAAHVPKYRRLTAGHFHWPIVILEETQSSLATGGAGNELFYRVCAHGLCMARVANPATGHTMLPDQPLLFCGGTDITDPVTYCLRVYNASAFSMSPGLFAGKCLGLSTGDTIAYLPIHFWPFGWMCMPTTGQLS